MCTYPSLYSSDECVGKPAPPVTVWLDGIYFWTRSFGLLFPGDPAVLTWFLVFIFSVCMSYVDANPFTIPQEILWFGNFVCGRIVNIAIVYES